jgi:cytochrome-b5 reductase
MSPSQRMFGWKLFAIGSTCLSFYFVFGRSITNEGSGMGEILGPPSSTLAPRTFVHGTVLSVKPSPPEEGSKASHVIVKMSFPRQHLPKDGSHYTNAIHHVYIKDDDMQIERPYTPILGLGLDGKMEFWVKKYPRGEVSNWISRLMRGRNIEIRGPIQQWDWRANPYDEIIMVCYTPLLLL